MEKEHGIVPKSTGMLQQSEKEAQAALWQLLAEQTAHCTMGESTSVPVELAGELLASLRFCIAQNDKPGLGAKEAWQRGQTRLKGQVQRGKALLHAVRQTAVTIENQAYHDTLEELERFFTQYDLRFFAHQIPCMIDYQLAAPVPELPEGVLFINAYLQRLLLENRFVGCFTQELTCKLLEAYCPDYRGLLINLLEPVFANALGLVLLGKEPGGLELTDGDRERLQALLSPGDGENSLREGVPRLLEHLNLADHAMQQYLLRVADGLAAQVKNAGNKGLEGIFLSFAGEKKEEGFVFQDGAQMEDEALRALLAQLQDCPAMDDKLALLHGRFHSLADLTAALHTCFWGREFTRVYASLPPGVLAALANELRQGWDSPEEYPRWGKALANYLEQHRT